MLPVITPSSAQRLEAPSAVERETGFSSKKHLALALVISAVAAAILPFVFPVSIALFTAASWYLYSAAIIELKQLAQGSCLESLANQLYATAMEVNAVICAAILFPLTFFKSTHTPQGNPEGRPILLVNGYLSYGSIWRYQKQSLEKAELGPVYSINVGSGRSIISYAKQIQEKVEQIQKETGRSDIALVGHSKGGIVSSYYATHLADPEKTQVTDVITIGSPLRGTSLAYFALGYDAEEMRPESEFLTKLRGKIAENSNKIRFSYIAAARDRVAPFSSALPNENCERKLVLPDMGHLAPVFSSRVADQLCIWLKQ